MTPRILLLNYSGALLIGILMAGAISATGSNQESPALLDQSLADVEQLLNQPHNRLVRSNLAQNLRHLIALHQARLSSSRDPGEKQKLRGLETALAFEQSLNDLPDPPARLRTLSDLREILSSLKNRDQPPVEPHYEFFTVPYAFVSRLHSGIGGGESQNDKTFSGPACENAHSPASTFWRRPAAIGNLDLYYGFNRKGVEWPEEGLWRYAGPKVNYGVNAGFDVTCGKFKARLKFGEQRSEPFAARIFWALGYNVDPTDYCAGLRLKYDRKIFSEFNSRKEIQTQFRLLVLPLYTLRLQKQHDPFACIASAVMKDGRKISGSELKQELLIDVRKSAADSGNFRADVEQGIDYLITVPANIQIRNPDVHGIGPWKFNDLGHEKLRELRGTGLLAAWIGWNDCRFHNTRLKVQDQDGTLFLRHYFSDLGGGLGNAKGLFSGKAELPNEFGWTFTRPEKFQGKGRMTIPFRITGYRPMERNRAFTQMTEEDARWMARLISQLTEAQIVDALKSSGFNSAELELYTEKLISRRDRMIVDLGLTAEIPLLRPGRSPSTSTD